MSLINFFFREALSVLKHIGYRGIVFFRALDVARKFHARVKFNGLPVIRGRVCFGKNVVVNSNFFSNMYGLSQRCILYAYDGADIVIGDNVGLSGVSLNARKHIEIGAGTLIGGNAKIMDHDFHPIDFRFRNPDDTSKIGIAPVRIGENCFVGGGY